MINSRADLTHYGLNAKPTEKPATIGAVPTEHAFRQAASRSNQPNSAAMLAADSSQLAAARSQAGRLWLRARRSEPRLISAPQQCEERKDCGAECVAWLRRRCGVWDTE